MKILKRILQFAFVLGIIGYGYAAWTLSDRVLFPTSSLEKTKSSIVKYWGTTYEASMKNMPAFKSFNVKSKDGLKISAKYFQTSDSSSCAIIFSHGWGAVWADMLKYVTAFSSCNCDYVMYDHRVHGNSEGEFATGGIKEADDLWRITQWVNEKKGYKLSEIGWVGSSWGAATTLIAGSNHKNVGFILADSPYQDWYSAVFERAIQDYGRGIKLIGFGVMQVVNYRAGVDYLEASPKLSAARILEPVLLIHSMADSETSSSQSVNISKNLNKDSWFFHTEWGSDHVMDVVNNPEEYGHLIYDFLFKEAPQFLKITKE
jgi:pimeloyl-ACP methyl ester carboxylesterase